MSEETKSSQDFDPVKEWQLIIDMINQAINQEIPFQDEQNLNSRILQNIQIVLNMSHTMHFYNLLEILKKATQLFLFTFSHQNITFSSEILTIFDQNQSFYQNNAENKQSSFAWTQVIEYFLTNNPFELIFSSIDNKSANLNHFLCLARLISKIFPYFQYRNNFPQLHSILFQSMDYFRTFINNHEYLVDFITVFQIFLSIFLSTNSILLSEDLGRIIFDLGMIFITHSETSLPIDIMITFLSTCQFSPSCSDFDLIISMLFKSKEDHREKLLNLVDLLLSSDHQITENHFLTNSISLENNSGDIWSILSSFFEKHEFEAFDDSAIGFIINFLDSLHGKIYNNANINFIHLAEVFIRCQNIRTKKIDLQPLNKFTITMIPLDYDFLLFNLLSTGNHIEELQTTIVKLYEHVQSSIIPDVINTFCSLLDNSQNNEQFHSFSAILNTLLQFSKTIETENEFVSEFLNIKRHKSTGKKQYPLQVQIIYKDTTFPLSCDLTMKILDLKSIIATKLGLRYKGLYLYCDTRWLQDSFTVGDYHIAYNTRIEVGGQFHPISKMNYPSVILLKRNFTQYLLDHLESDPESSNSILTFLDFLPTEPHIDEMVSDDYSFINLVRNAPTISHLQYILDSYKHNCHSLPSNVFESLYIDMNRMKFGQKGIYLLLEFFQFYFLIMNQPIAFEKFIPHLLLTLVNRYDKDFYLLAISLLNNFLKIDPQETTKTLLANPKLFSDAIRAVPDDVFDNMKQLVCSLNDPISTSLFAFAYSNEDRFSQIYQIFKTDGDHFLESMKILEVLDEDHFGALFDHLFSKLSRQTIDQNKEIINKMLDMALKTQSDSIRQMIYDKVAFFYTKTVTVKQCITDFAKTISSTEDSLSSYNIRTSDFDQSDSKFILTDRTDISSVVSILCQTFPFNYYMITHKSFDFESLYKMQYLFKQMVILLSKSVDGNEMTQHFLNDFKTYYNIKSIQDPTNFFNALLQALPNCFLKVFTGTLKTSIEGDYSDFRCEHMETFSHLTVPILGFSDLSDSLFYFFNHTQRYTGDTQYFIESTNQYIDAHKTLKFAEKPPILVLHLNRNYKNGAIYHGGINVPPALNVNSISTDIQGNYLLHAAIIRDKFNQSYKSIIKTNNDKWLVYYSNDVKSESYETISSMLKDACVVFYLLANSKLSGIVNDIKTDVELQYPFDLSQYVDLPTKNYLNDLNIIKTNQRSAFSLPTINFMKKYTPLVDYFKYFINVLCRSDLTNEVEEAVKQLKTKIISLPINNPNLIINSLSTQFPENQPSFVQNKAASSSTSDLAQAPAIHHFHLARRGPPNINQLLQSLEENFPNVVSALTYSNHSILLSNLITLILSRAGIDQSFTFISKCVSRITKEKKVDEASPLSRLVLKFILLSDDCKVRTTETNWGQELLWFLFYVYDYSRDFSFLVNLDFSNLFNVLSILISMEHRPNDIGYLLNIKDQILVSPKHKHSFISFMFKLDSSNVLRSVFANHAFSTTITNFEMNLGQGQPQPIPDGINLPDFFTEIQRQIETGNESLRSGVLNYYDNALTVYLGHPNEEVRETAKKLYYAVHDDPKFRDADSSIRKLLANFSTSKESSTIIEIVVYLMKKWNLYDTSYLLYLFQNTTAGDSTYKTSASLILSVCQLYKPEIIEPFLCDIIESIPGPFNGLIEYLVQNFSTESISKTLHSARWFDIIKGIDNNHYSSLIFKLIASPNLNKIVKKFILNALNNDKSLSLINTFLSSTISLFTNRKSLIWLFKTVEASIRHANDTISQSDKCQYYQRSIINFSNIITSYVLPKILDEDSFSSASSFLSESTSKSSSFGNKFYLIDPQQILPFFSNFWGQLSSEKLIDLLLYACCFDHEFEEDLIDAIKSQMELRVEFYEKDKWYLAIVLSKIILNSKNQFGESVSSILTSIYNQSLIQHNRKDKSKPTELFNFYLNQLSLHPNAKWITQVAQTLLPEAHFLCDEEREFYTKIFSTSNQMQIDEVINELIHQNGTNVVPVGSLDLQRITLLSKSRKDDEEAIKKSLTESIHLNKEEAFDLAKVDFYLVKFVTYLYTIEMPSFIEKDGEIEFAVLSENEEIDSTHSENKLPKKEFDFFNSTIDNNHELNDEENIVHNISNELIETETENHEIFTENHSNDVSNEENVCQFNKEQLIEFTNENVNNDTGEFTVRDFNLQPELDEIDQDDISLTQQKSSVAAVSSATMVASSFLLMKFMKNHPTKQ